MTLRSFLFSSVVYKKMVYRGHIDAQTKAYVRCLRLQSDLTVREIVHLCGISRASVYRCLNTNTCDKNSHAGHAGGLVQ